VFSSREIIEKNGPSDEAEVFCTIKQGHCPDNKACNFFCLSVFYPHGGSCVSNKSCCKQTIEQLYFSSYFFSINNTLVIFI